MTKKKKQSTGLIIAVVMLGILDMAALAIGDEADAAELSGQVIAMGLEHITLRDDLTPQKVLEALAL